MRFLNRGSRGPAVSGLSAAISKGTFQPAPMTSLCPAARLTRHQVDFEPPTRAYSAIVKLVCTSLYEELKHLQVRPRELMYSKLAATTMTEGIHEDQNERTVCHGRVRQVEILKLLTTLPQQLCLSEKWLLSHPIPPSPVTPHPKRRC